MGRELVDPRRSALESVMPRVPVDDAITGVTTALFVAVAGATPWAFGVLIYQHPAAWQSAAGRYALLLAQAIVLVTAVVVGAGVVRSRAAPRTVPSGGAVRATPRRARPRRRGGGWRPRGRLAAPRGVERRSLDNPQPLSPRRPSPPRGGADPAGT